MRTVHWLAMCVLVLAGCGSSKKCGPGTCPANEACGPTGVCEALKQCTSSTGCAAGEQCVGGTCSSCSANVQCSAGYAACDPTTNACGGCSSNDQCGGGLNVCKDGACVECASNSDCPSAAPECVDNTCRQCDANAPCAGGLTCAFQSICTTTCVSDTQCSATAPHCVSGYCAACATDADCNGERCVGGACHPALPGDFCQNALPLDLSSGSVLLQLALGGYSLQSDLPFGWFGGVDAYYAIDLSASGFLSANPTVAGSPAPTELAVLEGGCDALKTIASGGTLDAVFLPPGHYLLRVKEQSDFIDGTPPFTLSVRFDPEAEPAGAYCLAPVPVVAAVPSVQTIAGSPVGPADPRCGSPDAGSQTFAVQLEAPAFVDLTAESHTDAGVVGFSAFTDCPLGEPGDFCRWGPTATATLRLDAGVTYVRVSSPDDFNFTVQTHAVIQNDTCATALPLAFDGGVASAQIDTRYADEHPIEVDPGICELDSSHHGIYLLSTVGMGPHSLTIDGQGFDGGVPAFQIDPSCIASPPMACTNWQRLQSLEIPHLPEGTYYLHMAALSASNRGPMAFTATLGPDYPPPPNDSCASATPLDLTAATQTFSGDTRGAVDDFESQVAGCYLPTSRDVVYALTTPTTRGHVEVVVNGTSAGFSPAIQEEGYGSCGSGYESGCALAPDGGTSVTAWFSPQASPSYVWVEGQAGAGAFTGTAQWVDAPTNDQCSAPTPISVGQTVSGDTSAAFNDSQPCTTTANGPDVFYSFTPTQSATVTATLTPSGFDASLGVFVGCSTTSCTASSDVAGVGGTETVTFNASRNTTYLIAVDSAYGSAGPYTLTLQ